MTKCAQTAASFCSSPRVALHAPTRFPEKNAGTGGLERFRSLVVESPYSGGGFVSSKRRASPGTDIAATLAAWCGRTGEPVNCGMVQAAPTLPAGGGMARIAHSATFGEPRWCRLRVAFTAYATRRASPGRWDRGSPRGGNTSQNPLRPLAAAVRTV